MKKLFCVMLGLALLPCVVAVPVLAQGESNSGPRAAAPTVVPIYKTSSNPLIIYVASDLSAQVAYKLQTNWQVNPPTSQWADSGFFAAYSGKVYGPDFGSHPLPGGTLVPTPYPIPWTLTVWEGTPNGSGTDNDPWVLRTTVKSADGNLQVEQKVSYVNGAKEAVLEWIINNNSGGSLVCQFTHAVAMYMQGDGNAFGYYNPATGAVGGYNQARNWYEQLMPVAQFSSAYEVDNYGTIWGNIIGNPAGTGPGLNNNVNPAYTPLAAALQWNVTLPADSTVNTIFKEKWQFGVNPPYPPTPTPTPPPPVSGVSITLNSTTLTAGNQFTVDVTVQPVNQRFDAWAVIVGGGKKYSMVLNKPGQVRGGLYAYITRVKKRTRQFSGHLLNIQIPPGVTGSYNVIVGLVPSGQKPSVRNVISGYLAQTSVTVQ